MSTPIFSPPMLRLLDLMECNLHAIVREVMTREQAIEIKRRFGTPLGVLNSKHGFQSDKDLKDIVRKNHVFVDKI